MKFPAALLLTLPILAALALVSCDSKKPAAADVKSTAKADEGEWCAEHGLPESMCTKCHPNLIAGYKQKGDWCKEHNVPESQCLQCDPTLKEKFEAMKPKG